MVYRIILFFIYSFQMILLGQQNSFPIPKVEYNPKNYICYRAKSKINIDGKFSELDWAQSCWSDTFVDIEGNPNKKSDNETKVKMLWDDQYLYIAAKLHESDIRASITTHDRGVFHDNAFEFFLDPNGDTHNYYEYQINAFGTDCDIFLEKPYRDGENVYFGNYEICGLKKAVYLDGTINKPDDIDRAWNIELAVPWKALNKEDKNFQVPSNNEIWKINLSRVDWPFEVVDNKYKKKVGTMDSEPQYWVWSPQGLVALHYPEMWGNLQFSELGVGNGTSKIINDPYQWTKWELRKIYYAQKAYYINHKAYAGNLEKLEVNLPEDLKIKLEAKKNSFKASTNRGDKIITIYNDGLIRVE